MFLPDWEVLLQWVNVLEQRKATQQARQKEKLRQDDLRSRAGARVEAHPSSPADIAEDRQEGEAGEEHVEDDAAEEEDS